MPDSMTHDADREPPALLIATPTHDGKLHHGYVESLIATQWLLGAEGMANGYRFVAGISLIPSARREIAAMFLSESDRTHLLMVDSDIVWRAEDVPRLLRHDLDLVCGVYAQKPLGNPRLLFWRLSDAPAPMPRCERTGCLEIARGPAGFMLVKRAVFERLAASGTVDKITCAGGGDADRLLPWLWDFFPVGVVAGSYVGEDCGFCDAWRAIGGKVWMDPTIRLGHVGTHAYDNAGVSLLAQTSRRERGAPLVPPMAASFLATGRPQVVRCSPPPWPCHDDPTERPEASQP